MSLAARRTRSVLRNFKSFAPPPIRWMGLVAGLLATSGCSLNDNTFHIEGRGPSAAAPASAYGYRYGSTAPVVSAADLRAWVRRSTNEGRVVLLNVWAGWSRRCRAEIADLADLQAELPNEMFQVVSCCLDSADRWSSEIVPRLQGGAANYPCFVLADGQRAALRDWLDADWGYDLPARFLIDRGGEVVERLRADKTMADVRGAARRRAMHADDEIPSAVAASSASSTTADGTPSTLAVSSATAAETPPGVMVSSGSAELRLKLVNVRTGAWHPLDPITARPASAARLATQAVRKLVARLDRTTNPRIAVAPFAPVVNPRRDTLLGRNAARLVVEGLRSEGFYDLVAPARTRRMIEDIGITSLGVDHDPSILRGHLNVDYLILGWLRAPASEPRPADRPRRW